MGNCARYVMAAGFAAISAYTHADLNVEAGYTAEYTDNTALTADHETPEWIQTPMITITGTHDGDSITAMANYNASRAMHQRDSFNDQTNTVGTGHLTWRAITDRLTFDLSNASTLTTINSQDPNVQNNQQVISTTTAGTTLMLDSFSNHTIQLHYDYAFVNAGETDTDSQRQTLDAAYVIPMDQRQRIQFNATFTDVNYDASQNPDYISQSGDIQYVRNGDVIEIDTRIGFTLYDRQQQADNVSGTTGDIHLTWNISETTTANASFARSIQDQSASATSGIPDYGQEIVDNSNLTTPYTLDATIIGINTRLGHNTIDLNVHRNDLNYDGAQEDQDSVGTTLGITRPIRPTLNARMYVNYSTTDFKDQDRKDHYFSSGLRFEWTRWRDLTLTVGTTYLKQTSDLPSNEYNEWAGTLGLNYTLIGTRRR